jgi:hypothetical protein
MYIEPGTLIKLYEAAYGARGADNYICEVLPSGTEHTNGVGSLGSVIVRLIKPIDSEQVPPSGIKKQVWAIGASNKIKFEIIKQINNRPKRTERCFWF